MKKALFVIFHGFDSNNGIKEKIYSQVNALAACGIKVHLCYMDESSGKQRLIDDVVIADYGHGIISKIKKRTEFASVIKFAKENIKMEKGDKFISVLRDKLELVEA